MNNSGIPAEWASSPEEHAPILSAHDESGKVFNFIEYNYSDFVEGDNKQAMVDKVLHTLGDNGTAALLFEWNPSGLKSFLEKVDKLPACATPTPPAFQ
jgi:hypothetical protein